MSAHDYLTRRPGPYQAQHGEDRWLERYLGGKNDGFFVEVGAYDGVVLSNTFFFESTGWKGVLVEPDPAKAALCRANRPNSRVFECAAVSSPTIDHVTFYAVEGGEVYSTTSLTDNHRRRLEGYGLAPAPTRVAAMTLDAILESARATRIDFVTIDVEEGEIEVLKGFDIRRWKPAAVIVETATRFRKPEIRQYFVQHGYVFREGVGVNDIYVPFARSSLLVRIVDRFQYFRRRAIPKIQDRLKAAVAQHR
jgi:FkbM family methyltransferase